MRGDNNRSVINGLAIQTVWQSFSETIGAAEDWFTSNAPVPARPLQTASLWPTGATIVLDSKLNSDKLQEVCKYCDYKRICGIQETS